MKIGNSRFYPTDVTKIIDERLRREHSALKIKDLHEYIQTMQKVIPVIATMPFFWENAKIRYLTEFLGYKTLTDWVVVCPSDPPLDSLIAKVHTGLKSPTRAVKEWTMKLLRKDDIKK
jgi:hypothetical protein